MGERDIVSVLVSVMETRARTHTHAHSQGDRQVVAAWWRSGEMLGRKTSKMMSGVLGSNPVSVSELFICVIA